MKQVAPLRYGVIFKKAFCNVDIFKGFVRDILGIHLEITTVETEKEFKPAIGNVAVKFDLYAEDVKNRIIVEIQHDRNADHYDRFLHYHCVALLEQLKKPPKTAQYRYFSPNTTVYTIVVLTSGDAKNQCDVAVIDFDPKTLDGKALQEIKHKIVYLCPHYMNEKTPEFYREWLQVIEDSLDNQVDETLYHLPEIEKVLQAIEADDVTPDEMAKMIEESYIAEAEKRGLEQGIEKGIKKGIEKGIEEGEKRKAIELAKAMLAKGLDLKTVFEITGLTQEMIL
jgi:predicted transposase/invertase (TIGR01784 family)